MDLTLPVLAGLLRRTLADPRGVARDLVALQLPLPALWLAMALIAALSAILAHLTFTSMMMRMPEGGGFALPSPIATAVVQFGVLAMMSLAVHQIGRRFGGRGTQAGAAVIVIWVQFVLVALQAAQLVALFVLPPVADLLGLAGIALFLWLLTAFVAELHGFRSTGQVFVGVIVSIFAVAFALATVLTLLFGGPPAMG
jgi:hypothetical protein